MPAFQDGGVHATPWGELWVERSVAADEAPTFDVFDRRAQLIKQVVFPKGRRVVGFGRLGMLSCVDHDRPLYSEGIAATASNQPLSRSPGAGRKPSSRTMRRVPPRVAAPVTTI